MSLIGLTRRHKACKVCTVITDDNVLNQLNIDLILSRKTIKEIINEYGKYIPENIPPLNHVNLLNHKKHCDPSTIAEEILRRKNQPITPGDFVSILYAERFKERIDKQNVLHAIYKERINNIQFLRDLLEDKQKEYERYKSKEDPLSREDAKKTEKEIREIISQIDSIERDIQSVILQDIKVEKGPGNTYINNNVVNIFENDLKSFMDEFIPRLVYEVLSDDTEKAKEVISLMSMLLDKHISPSMKKLKEGSIGNVTPLLITSNSQREGIV